MHVLILTDRLGPEQTKDALDTKAQVKAVREALKSLGHTVEVAFFSMNLALTGRRIERSGCDVVFNLVENLASSKLLHLPALVCESLGVRCTGGSAHTLWVTGDKLVAKHLLSSAGLPTPRWVTRRTVADAWYLHTPLILKPIAQEASVGITEASVKTFSTTEQLGSALDVEDLFGEAYIEGREFNLSILPGGKVLAPAQMLFVEYPEGKAKVVGYEAKWEEDSFAYQHTRRTFTLGEEDRDLGRELQHLALETYTLFGGTGYARVDFRVDAQGCPYILEMNSNPCIAGDSGFIAAAMHEGLSYKQVIDLLVQGV
ncbi:MAG: hypothetical protein AB7C91_11010 [Sphaerochaeta sp.]|jgi:D-alanine-D-alanine ligase|uniref:D-alanine--D-alanine ligase family protein n=1 Tax=Sphaerochaeta sp. TaxID=1972642 RepID=UPI002FCC4880